METKRKFITALSNMTMLKAPKVITHRARRAGIALLTAAAMLITPLGGIGPFFALEAFAGAGDMTFAAEAENAIYIGVGGEIEFRFTVDNDDKDAFDDLYDDATDNMYKVPKEQVLLSYKLSDAAGNPTDDVDLDAAVGVVGLDLAGGTPTDSNNLNGTLVLAVNPEYTLNGNYDLVVTVYDGEGTGEANVIGSGGFEIELTAREVTLTKTAGNPLTYGEAVATNNQVTFTVTAVGFSSKAPGVALTDDSGDPIPNLPFDIVEQGGFTLAGTGDETTGTMIVRYNGYGDVDDYDNIYLTLTDDVAVMEENNNVRSENAFTGLAVKQAADGLEPKTAYVLEIFSDDDSVQSISIADLGPLTHSDSDLAEALERMTNPLSTGDVEFGGISGLVDTDSILKGGADAPAIDSGTGAIELTGAGKTTGTATFNVTLISDNFETSTIGITVKATEASAPGPVVDPITVDQSSQKPETLVFETAYDEVKFTVNVPADYETLGPGKLYEAKIVWQTPGSGTEPVGIDVKTGEKVLLTGSTTLTGTLILKIENTAPVGTHNYILELYEGEADTRKKVGETDLAFAVTITEPAPPADNKITIEQSAAPVFKPTEGTGSVNYTITLSDADKTVSPETWEKGEYDVTFGADGGKGLPLWATMGGAEVTFTGEDSAVFTAPMVLNITTAADVGTYSDVDIRLVRGETTIDHKFNIVISPTPTFTVGNVEYRPAGTEEGGKQNPLYTGVGGTATYKVTATNIDEGTYDATVTIEKEVEGAKSFVALTGSGFGVVGDSEVEIDDKGVGELVLNMDNSAIKAGTYTFRLSLTTDGVNPEYEFDLDVLAPNSLADSKAMLNASYARENGPSTNVIPARYTLSLAGILGDDEKMLANTELGKLEYAFVKSTAPGVFPAVNAIGTTGNVWGVWYDYTSTTALTPSALDKAANTLIGENETANMRGKAYADPGAEIRVYVRYKEFKDGDVVTVPAGPATYTSVKLPGVPERPTDKGTDNNSLVAQLVNEAAAPRDRAMSITWSEVAVNPVTRAEAGGGSQVGYRYNEESTDLTKLDKGSFGDIKITGYEYMVTRDGGLDEDGQTIVNIVADWTRIDTNSITEVAGGKLSAVIPPARNGRSIFETTGEYKISIRSVSNEGEDINAVGVVTQGGIPSDARATVPADTTVKGTLSGNVTVVYAIGDTAQPTGAYRNRIGTTLTADPAAGSSTLVVSGTYPSGAAGRGTVSYRWFYVDAAGIEQNLGTGASYEIKNTDAGRIIKLEVSVDNAWNKYTITIDGKDNYNANTAVDASRATVPFNIALAGDDAVAEKSSGDRVSFGTSMPAGTATAPNVLVTPGRVGDGIRVNYVLRNSGADFYDYFRLDPRAVEGDVYRAGSGTADVDRPAANVTFRPSQDDASKAENGVIEIAANFVHTTTRTSVINFRVREWDATFGDGDIDEAILKAQIVAHDYPTAGEATSAIKYEVTSGSDVAEVDEASGVVRVKKVGTGTAVITASLPSGAEVPGSTVTTSYTLNVVPKPLDVNLEEAQYIAGTVPGVADADPETGFVLLVYEGVDGDENPYGKPDVSGEEGGDDIEISVAQDKNIHVTTFKNAGKNAEVDNLSYTMTPARDNEAEITNYKIGTLPSFTVDTTAVKSLRVGETEDENLAFGVKDATITFPLVTTEVPDSSDDEEADNYTAGFSTVVYDADGTKRTLDTPLPAGITVIKGDEDDAPVDVVVIKDNAGTLTLVSDGEGAAPGKYYITLTLKIPAINGENDKVPFPPYNVTAVRDFVLEIEQGEQEAPKGKVVLLPKYDVKTGKYEVTIEEYDYVKADVDSEDEDEKDEDGVMEYRLKYGEKDWSKWMTYAQMIAAPLTNVELASTVYGEIRFAARNETAPNSGVFKTAASEAIGSTYILAIEPGTPGNPAAEGKRSEEGYAKVDLNWSEPSTGGEYARVDGVQPPFGLLRYEIEYAPVDEDGDWIMTEGWPRTFKLERDEPVVPEEPEKSYAGEKPETSATIGTIVNDNGDEELDGDHTLAHGTEYGFVIVAVNEHGIPSEEDSDMVYAKPMADYADGTEIVIISSAVGEDDYAGNQIGAELEAKLVNGEEDTPEATVQGTVNRAYSWVWTVGGEVKAGMPGNPHKYEIKGADVGKAIGVRVSNPAINGGLNAIFDDGNTVPYNVVLNVASAGKASADSIEFAEGIPGRSPNGLTVPARAGTALTMDINLVRSQPYNRLSLNRGMGISPTAFVDANEVNTAEAHTDTRTYVVNPAHVYGRTDGSIVINANFRHGTPINRDIWFAEEYVKATYGDAPFTNALSTDPDAPALGTGTNMLPVTYSVTSGQSVVAVNATTGEITIRGVGTATIQASSKGNRVGSGDDQKTYSDAVTTFTIEVERKPVEVFLDHSPGKTRYRAATEVAKGDVWLEYERVGTTNEVRIDRDAVVEGDVLSFTVTAANSVGSVPAVPSTTARVTMPTPLEFTGAARNNYRAFITPFNVDSTKVKSLSIEHNWWDDWLIYGGGVNPDGSSNATAMDNTKKTLYLQTTELPASRAAGTGVTAISYTAEVRGLPTPGVRLLNANGTEATNNRTAVVIDDQGRAQLTLGYNGTANATDFDATVIITATGINSEFAKGTATPIESEVELSIDPKGIHINTDRLYYPDLQPARGPVEIEYVGEKGYEGLYRNELVQKTRGGSYDDVKLTYKVHAWETDDRYWNEVELPKWGSVELIPSRNAWVDINVSKIDRPHTEQMYGLYELGGADRDNYWLDYSQYVDSTVFVKGISLTPENETLFGTTPKNFKVEFENSAVTDTTPKGTEPYEAEIAWSTFPAPVVGKEAEALVKPITHKDTTTALEANVKLAEGDWEIVELRASYRNAYLATATVDLLPADADIEARLLVNRVDVNRARIEGARLPVRVNMPIEAVSRNEFGEITRDVNGKLNFTGVKLYQVGTDRAGLIPANEVPGFEAYADVNGRNNIIISSTDSNSSQTVRAVNADVWVLAAGQNDNPLNWVKASNGSVSLRPTISYPSIRLEGAQLNSYFPNRSAILRVQNNAAASIIKTEVVGTNASRIAAVPGTSNQVELVAGVTKGSAKARVTLTVDGFKDDMLRKWDNNFKGNQWDVTVKISNAKPSLALSASTQNIRAYDDPGHDVWVGISGRNDWTRNNLSQIDMVKLYTGTGNRRALYVGDDYDPTTGLNRNGSSGAYGVWIPGTLRAGSYSLGVTFGPGSEELYLNLNIKNPKVKLSVKPSTIVVNGKVENSVTIPIVSNVVNFIDPEWMVEGDYIPYKVTLTDGKDAATHELIDSVDFRWDGKVITVNFTDAAAKLTRNTDVKLRISGNQANDKGPRTTNVVNATLRITPNAAQVAVSTSGRINVADPASKMTVRLSYSNATVRAAEPWYDEETGVWYASGVFEIGTGTGNNFTPSKDFEVVDYVGSTWVNNSFQIQMKERSFLLDGEPAPASGAQGHGYGYLVPGHNYDLQWRILLANGEYLTSWDNAKNTNSGRIRVTPNLANAKMQTPGAVTLHNRDSWRSGSTNISISSPASADYDIINFAGSRGVTRLANGTIQRTDGFGGGSGIEVSKAGYQQWTFRMINRESLKHTNGKDPKSSYNLKMEVWPYGTYALDAAGEARVDSNGRPLPIQRNGKNVTKPTNVTVRVNVTR